MKYFLRNISARVIGLPSGKLILPDAEVEVDGTTVGLPSIKSLEGMRMLSVRTEESAKVSRKVDKPSVDVAEEPEAKEDSAASGEPVKKSRKKKAE